MRTIIIINANACGGKAVSVYKSIEGRISDAFGDLTVAISEKPDDLSRHLEAVSESGLDLVIAVGGDGTNHSVINALARQPGLGAAFSCLPVGTGTDWGRALGIPSNPAAALDWILQARPVPCDLGKVEYSVPKNGGRRASRYFLNISSLGVSGEIVARVNRLRRRTSLTFLRTTIAVLLKYRPRRITVECDGRSFYQGTTYLLAVANGRCFGRGMWVAPNALVDDGLFDAVLVEGMPRLRILLALRTVFSGRHLRRKDVHFRRAALVRVRSEDGPFCLELDGEEAHGEDLLYTVSPRALKVLMHPSSSGLLKPQLGW